MLFLKDKPCKVLLVIKNSGGYLSKIAKEADVTFPYIASLIKVLEAKNIVSTEHKGKFVVARLTEKGLKIAKRIEEVWEFEKEA